MDTEIIIVIAASVFVFCLLMFLFNFVLKYQKKTHSFIKEKEVMKSQFERTLLQSQIEVQESTFSALGKELHDNIGQLLSTAKLLLGITERNIHKPPDTLVTANETIGLAIRELRALSKSLNVEWLEQFDLLNNLEREVDRINSAEIIKLHFSHTGKLFFRADKQIILFRIIQEAIQNAIKHSGGSDISIEIYQKENFIVEIKDNGNGFDVDRLSNGVGILNMKNRAKLLGGHIKLKSSNKGSIISFIMPIDLIE